VTFIVWPAAAFKTYKLEARGPSCPDSVAEVAPVPNRIRVAPESALVVGVGRDWVGVGNLRAVGDGFGVAVGDGEEVAVASAVPEVSDGIGVAGVSSVSRRAVGDGTVLAAVFVPCDIAVRSLLVITRICTTGSHPDRHSMTISTRKSHRTLFILSPRRELRTRPIPQSQPLTAMPSWTTQPSHRITSR
jgi:hypothetical protein